MIKDKAYLMSGTENERREKISILYPEFTIANVLGSGIGFGEIALLKKC